MMDIHNILRLFDNLRNFLFTSKRLKQSVIISNKHVIYELSHELPSDLRLTSALLNSAEKFFGNTKLADLTLFICLHNQLSYLNSIIVQMSEKRESSNRQ